MPPTDRGSPRDHRARPGAASTHTHEHPTHATSTVTHRQYDESMTAPTGVPRFPSLEPVYGEPLPAAVSWVCISSGRLPRLPLIPAQAPGDHHQHPNTSMQDPQSAVCPPGGGLPGRLWMRAHDLCAGPGAREPDRRARGLLRLPRLPHGPGPGCRVGRGAGRRAGCAARDSARRECAGRALPALRLSPRRVRRRPRGRQGARVEQLLQVRVQGTCPLSWPCLAS